MNPQRLRRAARSACCSTTSVLSLASAALASSVMGWLMRGGEVLASLEVADTRRSRRRGLLGRDGIEGVLLLWPARSVHTLGMRFPIDVAWCDADLRVLRVAQLRPHRLSRPVARARAVIEAEAGSFARWGLTVGDVLERED